MKIVLFEPTSVAKASVIFEDPVKLGVYPSHSIDLITPNLYELKAMFKAAEKKHLFEGIEWWDMLDSFNLTAQFRQGTSLTTDTYELCADIRCRCRVSYA
jgi:hypothetical protein